MALAALDLLKGDFRLIHPNQPPDLFQGTKFAFFSRFQNLGKIMASPPFSLLFPEYSKRAKKANLVPPSIEALFW